MVAEARRRREAHENLESYLERIARAVAELDPAAEAYLFGSVAEGRSLPSSDIDILVVTERSPGEVISHLWRRGIGTPFEVHVVPPGLLEAYRRRSRLVRIL